MVAPNILRHYQIEHDEEKQNPRQVSTPTIIKPTQAEEDKTRKIHGEDSHPGRQPVIQLHKDDHGILTAIEVTCSCGQHFTISLEYE